MDYKLIAIAGLTYFVSIVLTFFIAKKLSDKKIRGYKSISEALSKSSRELSELDERISASREIFEDLDQKTKDLQSLQANAEDIENQLKMDSDELESVSARIKEQIANSNRKSLELNELMQKLDLYSRIDELSSYGHFEQPQYLHETSLRFSEEIKRVREDQKILIKNNLAVRYPSETVISNDKALNNTILKGQVKLMLTSFNIECDFLIGKVNPSNYSKTLDRIEKLANTIEKSAATLHCGFDIEYVELKFKECQLQYQYVLKKQEEQAEQKLIKEQMREEQRAIKEYEKAMAAAEKEERMYRDMLEKARSELSKASEEEREVAEQRIADLERQLSEAEAKEERAKSMAEQTRKGHVYVISNIGSFGDDVYKIGLTRRLEPMDRVKELGDASVPFSFDVHAMIYVEDAPALEAALHREFTHTRVNAVNLRKEFFRTDLKSIKTAVEKLIGEDAEFKTTVLAEEYYESKRLQGAEVAVA
ncbi:MAG: DUF4041 domain-containing protein [Pseudomonadales bacterium]|nr:DUF4041 domain-containing protein [Pseudomonadales bacterium]